MVNLTALLAFRPDAGPFDHARAGKGGFEAMSAQIDAIHRRKSLDFIGTSTHSGLLMSHSLALIRDWQTAADSGL
jgi:hypothetical protein